VLLGITTWLTWTVRPVQSGVGQARENAAISLSIVSLQRLMELASRLQGSIEGTAASFGLHQLVRFNVYNFAEEPATVCAVALKTIGGETLRCELVPSVVVQAGARYPFMFEILTGPVAEGVDMQVEQTSGQRVWVSAHCLPRP
jgi:hypothetical protein